MFGMATHELVLMLLVVLLVVGATRLPQSDERLHVLLVRRVRSWRWSDWTLLAVAAVLTIATVGLLTTR